MTSFRRTILLLSTCIFFIAALPAGANPTTAPSDPRSWPGVDEAMAAQLERVLPPIKFDAVGLGDVIDFLRDVSNANIFVNWKALEAAGIDKQAPVTANLRHISFLKCLRVVLDDVAGTKGKLAIAIDSGVITISTAADLGKDAIPPVRYVRHGRVEGANEPDAPPARLPEAMLKLKGKTVRILHELGSDAHGSYTDFLQGLLQIARAKVVRVRGNEVKVNAGDVLVMGGVYLPFKGEFANAIDEERYAMAMKKRDAYEKQRKQLAADAAAAGAQVVDETGLSQFLGLNAETDAAWLRYQEETFRRGLNQMLPPVKFDAVGLSDVIDFLRDVYSTNITVNWKALEAAGIDKQAPVTLHARNVAYAKVLEMILDGVGGGKGKIDFGVEPQSYVITISTAADLFGEPARAVVAKTYDVRFLLPETLEAGALDKRVAALLKLLVENIDPPSWGIHHGAARTAMEQKGQLIVVQTEKNQASIEQLIKHLQSLMPTSKP
jgi:hypothetical protein